MTSPAFACSGKCDIDPYYLIPYEKSITWFCETGIEIIYNTSGCPVIASKSFVIITELFL